MIHLTSLVADVTVIGDGPAACALIVELRRREHTVCWLVRRKNDDFCVGESLSPSGASSLQQLGLAHTLSGNHTCSPGCVSYWGGGAPSVQDYAFTHVGQGWNLRRREFNQSLCTAVGGSGVQIAEFSSIRSVQQVGLIWDLDLLLPHARVRTLRSRFVVDATGRSAYFSRLIGCRPMYFDHLVGLYGTTSVLRNAQDARLVIEPMEDGWWYSLVVEDQLIAVFLTDWDLHRRGKRASYETYIARLRQSQETKIRAERMPSLASHKVVSSQSQFNIPCFGKNWLAIGDAGMAFDPLSANGIGRALQDGSKSAEAISDTVLNGAGLLPRTITADRKRTFFEYLNEKMLYYRQETRWPNSPFWTRRQNSPQCLMPADNPTANSEALAHKNTFEC